MINIKQGIRLRNVLVIVISIVLVVFIPDEFLFRVKEMFTNKDVLLREAEEALLGLGISEFKSAH